MPSQLSSPHENPSPSEEETVVRLGEEFAASPTPKKINRTGRADFTSRDELEREQLETGESVQTAIDLDPEKQWALTSAENARRPVPIGWFVLILAAFGIGLAYFGLESEESSPSPSSVPVSAAADILQDDTLLPGAREYQEAEDDITQLLKLLDDFFAARVAEDFRPLVRHPEETLPLIASYLEEKPWDFAPFQKIGSYGTTVLSKRPFYIMQVTLKDDESFPILAEDLEGQPLIDWKSFVSWLPIDPEEFIKDRPSEPVDLRVYFSESNYYNYHFNDDQEFQSILLTFRDSDITLNAFYRRGTEVAKKFQLMREQNSGQENIATILRLSPPPPGTPNYVTEVLDVIARHWVDL